MSRETVAWTASMPSARSASATSACVESGCCCDEPQDRALALELRASREHLAEQVDGEVGLVGRDRQRRREAQRASRRRCRSRARARARPRRPGRPGGRARRRAAGRGRAPRRTARAAPDERTRTIARTCASSSSSIVVDDGAGGGARDGVAAEGRGVVAGLEAGRRVVGDEQRADRQAVREPLGERDRVAA